MSIYDKASLVLIPSGTKTSKVYSQKPVSGNGDFTFSRSTAATRVNADGNIEKETQNLLLQSNTFSNAVWADDAGGCTRTSGQSGYDGTTDAWLITQNGVGFENIVQSVSSSGVNTYSIYAKGSSTAFTLRIANTGDRVLFNLSTGSVASTFGSNLIDYGMTDIGGGWYRCYFTANATITDLNIYPYFNSTTATSVTIQDAQIEQGMVARDYIETTTAAVEGGITDNVPRLDYTDSSCPALLLEPQRSNLVTQSEYVDSWLKYNCTINSNAVVSPEGKQNAHKIVENTSLGYHAVYLNNVFTADGTYKTASVFVKAAGRNFCAISTRGAFGSSDKTLIFNLTTGEWAVNGSGQNTGLEAEQHEDGWWRIILNTDTTSAAYDGFIVGAAIAGDTWADAEYTGDGSSGIYVYGAQVEAGSYATSYIPTYGAGSVTRNGETCLGAGNSSLFNVNGGVLYCEFAALSDDGTFRQMGIAGTSGNEVNLSLDSASNRIGGIVRSGGTYYITDYVVTDTTQVNKVALKYEGSSVKLFVSGSLVDSLTTATAPLNLSEFNFAIGTTNANKFYGKVNQTIVFPTALTDEEIIALTTI